jgi:hypothetical protein
MFYLWKYWIVFIQIFFQRKTSKKFDFFVSIKHNYWNEAKIELFSLTESVCCQGLYLHSCMKLGKNHAGCYNRYLRYQDPKCVSVIYKCVSTRIFSCFKFSGVYVFGRGVRFGNVYCIIIDLYSDASELWYMKGFRSEHCVCPWSVKYGWNISRVVCNPKQYCWIGTAELLCSLHCNGSRTVPSAHVLLTLLTGLFYVLRIIYKLEILITRRSVELHTAFLLRKHHDACLRSKEIPFWSTHEGLHCTSSWDSSMQFE